jgi:phosphate transport system substrate-binding protein
MRMSFEPRSSLKLRIATTLVLVSTIASLGAQVQAQTPTPTELPPVKPADVKGDISVGGSSTVLPLTEYMKQAFAKDGYKGTIKLEEDGTGKGIERFCKGERDLIGTSRALKAEEIDTCKKAKRPAVELKIGIDAMVFVVSRNNRFLEALTTKQLQEIWSGKASTWKQIDVRWPDKAIALFGPAQTHSTYDFASEQLFQSIEKDSAARKKIIAGVKGITLKQSFSEYIALVQKDNFAMGLMSYSYYAANRAKLRVIGFDDVTPNDKTIAAGRYALTRNIYLVTTPTVLKERPQVNSFVNYYLAHLAERVHDLGYFPQSEKVNIEVRKAYLDAIK